jgi:WD40 repeat protein
MSRDETRRAIEVPTHTAGLALEAGLAELLLTDLGAVPGRRYPPGALPLLAHALFETWRRREDRVLTVAGYRAAGGIDGAVSRTAEAVYDTLGEAGQAAARLMLVRLVHVENRTLRRLTQSVLLAGFVDGTAKRVLDRLAGARLLTAGQDSVEIAHEALIRAWPRFRSWLDADSDLEALRQEIEADALRWERERRRDVPGPGWVRGVRRWWAVPAGGDLLYRGGRLAAVRERLHGRDLTDPATAAFIRASETQHRRVRLLRRGVVAALAVLLVAALTAAVTAARQQQRAEQHRRLAVSRQLVQTALALRDSQPRISLALSIAAFDRARTLPEARDALLSVQARYYGKALLPKMGALHAVAFSPDGRVLATAQHEKAACMWDVPGWERTCLSTASPVNGVAFNPGGSMLAGGCQDGDVVVWDTRTRRRMAELPGGPDPVNDVAFSPDGRTLATAGMDGAVILWDTRTFQKIKELKVNRVPVNDVAFSPDGRTLATATESGLGLWDLDSYSQRLPAGYTSPVRAVAFSPSGNRLATGSDTGAVRIWDMESLTPIAAATGHREEIRTVVFSPDGRMLATGGRDASVRLWNATLETNSIAQMTSLAGPTGTVRGVAFSPDGHTLASAGSDGAVGLWSVSGIQDDRLPDVWNAAVFGPGGRLATTGRDHTPLWWDAAGDDDFVPLPGTRSVEVASGLPHQAQAVAFTSRDLLVIAGMDGNLELRDTATLRVVKGFPLQPGPGAINAIAVHEGKTPHGDKDLSSNPDNDGAGRPHPCDVEGTISAATGGEDGVLRMSKISSTSRTPCGLTQIFYSRGPAVSIQAVAFDAGGTKLASGSDDGTVMLWDVAQRQEPARLETPPGNAGPVVAVSFSHDGTMLAGVSTDGMIRLWDVGSHELLATLTARAGTTAVAFQGDGDSRIFATADQHGTPVLWNSEVDRVRRRLCAELRAILTPKRDILTPGEWSENVPNEPYKPICG